MLATIALIASGAFGAALRVILDRTLPHQRCTIWVAELAVALLLGAVLGVPFAATLATPWVASSVSGALTCYAASSGTYAYLATPGHGPAGLANAAGHFLAITAALSIGFVAAILVIKTLTA